MELLDFVNEHLELVGFGSMALLGLWSVSRRKKQTKVAKKILKKAVETKMDEPLTLHPEIDPKICAGCASCTKVCPEGDILRMIDHKAVLVSPTKCVGHGECERMCPTNAISLVFGTKTRGMDIPRITSNYETNVPGLYIAGELGGMGLIRNAVKQGHLAAVHALEKLTTAAADTDLLVIGAGPAGLSAALTAVEKKKKYICIEQNSFGGTVYHFPRQKIVMTHPAEIPGVGKMKFPKNKVTKEELLEYWSGIREEKKLQIREGVRFESLEKQGEIFHVKTSQGVIKAKKVILCMGVRGSPRKLGLPNEDTPKVTYNLIDPEQYQGQDVAVVGGGNAGVEAAQYLGKAQYRNRVTLLVRGDGFDRCNEENKNIIERMAKDGLVKILFNSSVQEIHPEHLIVKTKDEAFELPNHFLFVFAGAEMPHKFLMSLGVKIEKRFGTKI
jgi:thioredoxin reductase (NADPH)